MMPSTL